LILLELTPLSLLLLLLLLLVAPGFSDDGRTPSLYSIFYAQTNNSALRASYSSVSRRSASSGQGVSQVFSHWGTRLHPLSILAPGWLSAVRRCFVLGSSLIPGKWALVNHARACTRETPGETNRAKEQQRFCGGLCCARVDVASFGQTLVTNLTTARTANPGLLAQARTVAAERDSSVVLCLRMIQSVFQICESTNIPNIFLPSMKRLKFFVLRR